MEYRVEELAAEAGVSVELLRSYQSKGLLPAPRHQGRLALYSKVHLDRLREIVELKHEGYSLRMIAHLLDHPAPAAATPGALGDAFGEVDEERFTLRELAARTRVPPAMLRSLEASGVLQPRDVPDDDRRYSTADVRAVRMLLSLISGGLPIEEFMAVAHTQIEAAARVAEGAVALFMRYVRQPLHDGGVDEAVEAEQLVSALNLMLQATTTLI